MSLSPPEQHALNQATLASVQSSLSVPNPASASTSTTSSPSRAPPTNFTHSPGDNPLLNRSKPKRPANKKKPSKAKAKASPVPESQLASAVEHAQEEELSIVDQPGVDSQEAGGVIDLADQLLAQLEMRNGSSSATTSSVPESAVELDATVSPKEEHHHHSSSLGDKIKGLGHDVKEAVMDGVGAGTDKKPNRQHQRKLRKQNGIAEAQAAARAEVAAENDRSVEDERVAIMAGCKKLGVRVKEIDPDGHCLFSSIADQANLLGLAPDSRKQTYVSARHGAAATMRASPDEFLPFLESEKEADGLMGAEEYARYCDTVESTGEWGGQPEIKALSKYYSAPIHVLQAGTDIVKTEDATLPPGRGPILISYHRKMYGLGEHYNSLVPVANPAANPDPVTAPVLE